MTDQTIQAPLKQMQPSVAVEIWRLKDARESISDPALRQRVDALTKGMNGGEKLHISGREWDRIQKAASTPPSQEEDNS